MKDIKYTEEKKEETQAAVKGNSQEELEKSAVYAIIMSTIIVIVNALFIRLFFKILFSKLGKKREIIIIPMQK